MLNNSMFSNSQQHWLAKMASAEVGADDFLLIVILSLTLPTRPFGRTLTSFSEHITYIQVQKARIAPTSHTKY